MSLVLLLDFDGTLSPIVNRPEKARLVPPIKKQLLALSRNPNITVGIVSGRDLRTVRKKVGLGSLIYAGNHGYEIQFPRKKQVIHPAAKKSRVAVQSICEDLNRKLRKGFPGVLVENKTWSASLHTRMASKKTEKKAHRIFNRVTAPYVKKGKIRITKGKKVLECRPPAKWDKGKAVTYILSKIKPKNGFPIYIGDDQTDEDAFGVLQGKGLGIKVGRARPTKAHYAVRSIKAMPLLLKKINSFWAPNH